MSFERLPFGKAEYKKSDLRKLWRVERKTWQEEEIEDLLKFH